jgi:hypothetical protein
MLHEAERHETLTAGAWNEQAARACINEILDDAVEKFSARDLWPSHPLDSFSRDDRWNLYIGAAAPSGRCTICALSEKACPTSPACCRGCWSPIATGY